MLKALQEAIRQFIDAHNENPKAFRWTKSADENSQNPGKLRCGNRGDSGWLIKQEINDSGD